MEANSKHYEAGGYVSDRCSSPGILCAPGAGNVSLMVMCHTAIHAVELRAAEREAVGSRGAEISEASDMARTVLAPRPAGRVCALLVIRRPQRRIVGGWNVRGNGGIEQTTARRGPGL